ncbi:uncharacterized protein F5Z01DRAFT_634920 [Emericellopsis atlantica]|uniref:Uncharacterized protein n=1 Tax=Emericellopsis atlantica TaxID=2614577 RepID=A0A9P7ZQG1_9HYPO|nr:uncharacterized protein F5Z01DRAFT_634920 [Emericellopsis atlantica]KAG9255951.1 hypothetical protein F5Z01DRAFT_634920 [Emericellopsis atlantica]
MLSTQAPNIAQHELSAFFESHFSGPAVAHFEGTFVKPSAVDTADHQEDDWAEEEQDDLGYYNDGVKRTLTDAQIEMFRHSELKTLRRQLEKDAAKAKNPTSGTAAEDTDARTDSTRLKEADLPTNFRSSKKRKKTRKPAEPKPDLRKRTWDVVDKGLDSLEYD